MSQTAAAAARLVRIPKSFYRDHYERDLPTPKVVKETRGGLWIAHNDPALPELLDDAKHYAEDGTDADRGLVTAARALVRALACA